MAFAYVENDTIIGDNVMIGSLTHIDYKVKIGDNTRIERFCIYSSINNNWQKCIHRSRCDFLLMIHIYESKNDWSYCGGWSHHR
jgi:NDP-sugar pyrophosphorylase family protein